MAICRDRLLTQCYDILEQIANNPDADFKARIVAHHLAGVIAAATLRAYTDGPTILSQHHRYPRTSLTEAEPTTGLRLKLSSSQLPYSIKEEEQDEEG